MNNIIVYWPKVREGGVEKSFFQYLNYISKYKKKIFVLCDYNSKKYISDKFNNQIKIIFLPNNKILRITKCFLILLNLNSRLLFAIQLDSFKLLFIFSIFKKIDIFYFERNNQFYNKQINFFWKWAICRSVNKLFVNSKYMKKCFKLFYKKKIYRIYNPTISKEIINYKTKKISNLKQNVNILVSGRNTFQKNINFVLNNVHIIKAEFPDCKINILTNNKKNLKINKIFKDRIQFQKFDQHLFKSIQKYDFCIFPSRYEGFPNFLLELCYLNFPVVSSKFNGHEEFKGMKNCKFFKLEDLNSFKNSLRALKKQKNFINSKKIFSNYNHNNSCKDFLYKINV